MAPNNKNFDLKVTAWLTGRLFRGRGGDLQLAELGSTPIRYKLFPTEPGVLKFV